MQELLKYLRVNAWVCVIVEGCLVHELASRERQRLQVGYGLLVRFVKNKGKEKKRMETCTGRTCLL